MIHLITGGSGSGKSSYAEEQIIQNAGRFDAPFLYVATMFPFGEETGEKIRRHQMQRLDLGFLTLEKYMDLGNLTAPENAGILLECVSNLTANEFYRYMQEEGEKEDLQQAYERTYAAVTGGIRHLSGQTEHLVIVTNEVFSDVQPYSTQTNVYRKLLGAVNCELAKTADRVTEVVYGIPVRIK